MFSFSQLIKARTDSSSKWLSLILTPFFIHLFTALPSSSPCCCQTPLSSASFSPLQFKSLFHCLYLHFWVASFQYFSVWLLTTHTLLSSFITHNPGLHIVFVDSRKFTRWSLLSTAGNQSLFLYSDAECICRQKKEILSNLWLQFCLRCSSSISVRKRMNCKPLILLNS